MHKMMNALINIIHPCTHHLSLAHVCVSFKNVCLCMCLFSSYHMLAPALVPGHKRTGDKYWEKGKFWKPFFHSFYFRHPVSIAIKLRALMWLSQAASSTPTPGLYPLPVLALLRVTGKTHRRIIFLCVERTIEFSLDQSGSSRKPLALPLPAP